MITSKVDYFQAFFVCSHIFAEECAIPITESGITILDASSSEKDNFNV